MLKTAVNKLVSAVSTQSSFINFLMLRTESVYQSRSIFFLILFFVIKFVYLWSSLNKIYYLIDILF